MAGLDNDDRHVHVADFSDYYFRKFIVLLHIKNHTNTCVKRYNLKKKNF